ncbi:carbohydrate-binding protein, partial [Streptosporangium carneum]|uniref:carbohydrate-binding protein n=2 Tax=Streptosporangium carneum TaxID=47481 RepID=UPI0034D9673A
NVRTVGNAKEATFDFVANFTGTPSPSPTITPTPTSSPTSPPASPWKAGTYYRVGDLVTYNGSTYRCLAAHTAYPGWEPPNYDFLWARV